MLRLFRKDLSAAALRSREETKKVFYFHFILFLLLKTYVTLKSICSLCASTSIKVYKLNRGHRAAIILASGCIPNDIDSYNLRACDSCIKVFIKNDKERRFLSACDSMILSFPPLVPGAYALRIQSVSGIRKQVSVLHRAFAQLGMRALPTGIRDERRRVLEKVVLSPVRPGEAVFLANRYVYEFNNHVKCNE